MQKPVESLQIGLRPRTPTCSSFPETQILAIRCFFSLPGKARFQVPGYLKSGVFRPRKKAAGGRNSPFPQNDRRVTPVGARKHSRLQQFVQGKRATAQYPSRNTGCFTVSELQNTKQSSVPRGIQGVSLLRNSAASFRVLKFRNSETPCIPVGIQGTRRRTLYSSRKTGCGDE